MRFMVAVIDPRLGETVLDPACGTGGFLVEAYKHSAGAVPTRSKDWSSCSARPSSAVEAKPLPYLLCQMNLLLHGLEFPTHRALETACAVKLGEIGDRDRVDVILTNPPFGGEEERGIQGNFPDDKQTTETALLFLQLIMRKLRRAPKPGRAARGRAQWHALRRWRGRSHQGGAADGVQPAYHRAPAQRRLCAIHRHPHQSAVLRPLRADQRNLVLRTTAAGGPQELHQDQPMQYEEFAGCLAWWKNRDENERAWRVKAALLAENNFNLDIKNPNRPDDYQHMPPEQLARDIIQKEVRIAALIREIQAMLKAN